MTNSPSGSDEMVSAEQRVRQVYPEAIQNRSFLSPYRFLVYDGDMKHGMHPPILGTSEESLSAAWEDAAYKLPTPVESRPTERKGYWCQDCRDVGMIHCSDPEHCGGMTEDGVVISPSHPLDSVPADRQWSEFCVYCGKIKGEHFGPPNDPAPVCYKGNPLGRRFMGSGKSASVPEKGAEPNEPISAPTQHRVSYVRERMSGISSAACVCGWFFESNSDGRTGDAGDEHLAQHISLALSQPSPAAGGETAPLQKTTREIIEIEVIHLKALRKIHDIPNLDTIVSNLEFALKPTPVAAKPVEEEPLLTCPFCNEMPNLYDASIDGDGLWVIGCQNEECEIVPKTCPGNIASIPCLIEYWNTRISQPSTGKSPDFIDLSGITYFIHKKDGSMEVSEDPYRRDYVSYQDFEYVVQGMRLASSPAAREEIPEWVKEIKEAAENVMTERTKTPKCMRCGQEIFHFQQKCPSADNWGSQECESSTADDVRVQAAKQRFWVLLTPESILRLISMLAPEGEK